MPRLARRLTTALLWLAIALTPLRGLAGVLMPLAMQSAPSSSTASAMPCHGVAAQDDGMGGPSQAAPATCAMCDLCHGPVMRCAEAVVVLPALPEPRPAADVPTPIEPRAPDGLFRPPRADLA